MTPFRIRFLVCAVMTTAAMAVSLLPATRTLEGRFYDMRCRVLSRHVEPAPAIVVIAIDDESLRRMDEELGRWPWPRAVLAEVVDYCSAARTLVMDILFAEADRAHGDSDVALVEAVARHGGVISAAFFLQDNNSGTTAHPPDRFALPGALNHLFTKPLHTSVITPFSPLMGSSAGLGHVNYLADRDGVTRKHLVAARMDGAIYPSLAVAGALHFLGLDADSMSGSKHHGFLLQGERWRLDRLGRMRFLESATPHKSVPIADVLDAARGKSHALPPDLFKDKVVLIGSLATGLEDDRQITPLSVYQPGVLVTATALDNLIQGRQLRVTPWPCEAALVLLVGMALLAVGTERPGVLVLGASALTVAYAAFLMATLFIFHAMLPVSGPAIAIALSGVGLGTTRWYRERARRLELESLERAKQQFTDMLVHDLRNQASPIVMALSILEDRLPDDPRAKSLLANAQAGARRMTHRISCLLDIRKMQEGHLSLSKEPVDMHALMEKTVGDYGPAADRAGVSVQLDPGNGLPVTHLVDPEVIGRVLENLLWNAVKYAPADTAIELTCSKETDGQMVLTIANHGLMMTPALKESAFTAFAHGSTASVAGEDLAGSGLGLPFCAVAVAAHDGTIQFTSPWHEPDDGVLVTVTLPA